MEKKKYNEWKLIHDSKKMQMQFKNNPQQYVKQRTTYMLQDRKCL